ncbi:hypothetical protein SO802_002032 [Lithocarpus litseifolius]|uniref:Uncharacterized protein n=1 Tax=Lithocarpus litseifolius TaxID=425828 RepID=A0AAW2DZM9_9ROSI
MEDTRKRHGNGDRAPEDTSDAKRTRHEEEEVEGDILAWLSEDEDTVSQLMELLDNAEKKSDNNNNNNNTMAKVRFIDDMYSAPFSYVTINGNEESCGSSFSDLDSSVMASVDTRGLVGIGSNVFGFKAEEQDGACGSSDGVARGGLVASGEEVGRAMGGCDDFGWDDQVLARFLGEDF